MALYFTLKVKTNSVGTIIQQKLIKVDVHETLNNVLISALSENQASDFSNFKVDCSVSTDNGSSTFIKDMSTPVGVLKDLGLGYNIKFCIDDVIVIDESPQPVQNAFDLLRGASRAMDYLPEKR